MRLFQSSTIMLAFCFFISFSNSPSAEITWVRDLVSDANTNSAPLASCLNKDANGIVVITRECPKGFFPVRGDCIFWEIGKDGNVVRRVSLKKTDGNTIQANTIAVGPGCAMASDNLGNFLTIGVLGEQRKERSAAVISVENATEPNVSIPRRIENLSVKKLIPLQDNTFALIGDRNGDGLYLRIDGQGKTIQEKSFEMGYHEMFTGVAQLKSDNLSLAVVGLSARIFPKNPTESSAENFILIYDSNQKLIHEDYFTEGIPGLLFPKVCCLDNGNLIVLYLKKSEVSEVRLWARCYTQELRLLWEKEIFVSNSFLFSFDVTSFVSAGFVAAMAQRECLEFYFLDNNGAKIGHVEYKGVPGGAFGVAGLNLIPVNGEIIAVFKEGTAGNIKECTIKAKVIALD